MKKLLISLLMLMVIISSVKAQNILKGIVLNSKGKPAEGATVLQVKFFRAATADSTGHFQLDISLSDTIYIKCSAIGFAAANISIPANEINQQVHIILKEEPLNLKEVVISAGSFEASDEKKTTVLKTFELATTPTATPDVFSAVSELPGTTKVGESEGLFVRGGAASETKAIIDGLVVDQPFFSSVPGVAQSGKFSPLMFKGTSFSSGGYSAQYGGALSSVLALQTLDLAQSSSTTFNINTAGISANRTQALKNASLGVNGSYYNLEPSFRINRQNYTYQNAPEGKDGNISFRLKGRKDGLFKLYASWGTNSVGLSLPNLDSVTKLVGFNLQNTSAFINSSYKKRFGQWLLISGISYSLSKDNVIYLNQPIQKDRLFSELRNVISRKINNNFTVSLGSSFQLAHYTQTNHLQKFTVSPYQLSNFAELEFYVGKHIATKTGIRQEYAPVIRQNNIAPRFSVAYVLNRHSQLSFAYGRFYQQPSEIYLYINTNLQFEKAIHYILSYQVIQNRRTFRTEVYYKKYQRLVREQGSTLYEPFVYSRVPQGNFENTGIGYASGFELFWYDKKTFSKLKYWISYSYLDTKRLFANYPIEAMPTFAAKHNVSVVAKYTIPKTTLNIGITYNYTSGRPYYNPSQAFLSGRTPGYHNLIITGNYAWFKNNNLFALYMYADNILGIKNVNNYAFTASGQRIIIAPAAYRSVFAGINITLAKHRSIMGINIQ